MRAPVVLLAAIVLACGAHQDTAAAQSPVHWRVAPATLKVAPGTKATIDVSAAIDDGWHIYAVTQGPGGPVPTKFTAAQGQPFTVGTPTATPAPHTEMDESFGIRVQMHEHSVHFLLPVQLTGARADTLRIRARYQACNAALCLPPQTAQLAVPVTVRSGRS